MSLGQEKDRDALLKAINHYLQDRQYQEEDDFVGGDFCPECNTSRNEPHHEDCLCLALLSIIKKFSTDIEEIS